MLTLAKTIELRQSMNTGLRVVIEIQGKGVLAWVWLAKSAKNTKNKKHKTKSMLR